jgi:hypothetical protein
MIERMKAFTYISGTGATLIESALEDRVNQWLESQHGRLVKITQSESERHGAGHHVTVCVWYVPDIIDG